MKKFLEKLGLLTPVVEIFGTVRQIGFVHRDSESSGYYAIRLEAQSPLYQFTADTHEVRQALALLRSGDRVRFAVKVPGGQIEVGGMYTVNTLRVADEAL